MGFPERALGSQQAGKSPGKEQRQEDGQRIEQVAEMPGQYQCVAVGRAVIAVEVLKLPAGRQGQNLLGQPVKAGQDLHDLVAVQKQVVQPSLHGCR